MPLAAKPIREIVSAGPETLSDDVLEGGVPVVLRGVASHWPMAQAARASAEDAVAYLRRFEAREAPPVVATVGPPEIEGRFFYNADMSGFNFRQEKVPLGVALSTLLKYANDPRAPAIYVGSTTIDTWLPGFRAENDLAMGRREPLASIWIGNRTRIAAHQDVPDNLACVVAGRRRVTLFPPEQLSNLYIGPLDHTPAGQPISLVDFAAPDFTRFPRFEQALAHAQVAELGPGDAVLIPSMWWHHMEALEPFNVLVNYWWRRSPAFLSSPLPALHHALWTLRDLPEREKRAWAEIFDYYVFGPAPRAGEHLPEPGRDLLGPIDEPRARRIRAMLINRLNR